MQRNSWTRENTTGNNFLYNAANELNQTSGWYEMFYRGYDPATGRMLQIDPYSTLYASSTTYNYALNNPVMMNDPNGGQAEAPPGTSVSAWNRIQRFKGLDHSRDFESWYDDGGGGGSYIPFWNRFLSTAQTGVVYHNNGHGGFASYEFTTNFGSTGETNVGENIALWGKVIVDEIYYDQQETQGGGLSVSHAGFGDDMLGLWSVASFGNMAYNESRSYGLVRSTKAVYDEYKSIRAFNSAYKVGRQAQLLSSLSSNLNALDVIKAGSKRMAFVGLAVGAVDMANKGFTNESKALFAADAVMSYVAFLGPVGAGAAAIYFTGRFVYDLYQASQDGK